MTSKDYYILTLEDINSVGNYADIDITDEFLIMLAKIRDIKCCGVLKPVKGRKSISCVRCAKQYYPLVGTIFEKTTTDITWWIIVIREFIYNPKIKLSDILNMYELHNTINYITWHRIYIMCLRLITWLRKNKFCV